MNLDSAKIGDFLLFRKFFERFFSAEKKFISVRSHLVI